MKTENKSLFLMKHYIFIIGKNKFI